MRVESGPDFDGVFRQGQGIEITDDAVGVVLECYSTAKVERDDSTSRLGIRVEVAAPDETGDGQIIQSSVLLDPDEAEALAGALRASAAEIRDGSFERETRDAIEAERE